MRTNSQWIASAQRGMTLMELLVVTAIISVLVAILLPAVQVARERVRRAQCQNNLHRIGIALHAYHGIYGHLPIGCIDKRVPRSTPNGRQLAWSATILPQLDEESLWRQVDFEAAYDSAANAAAAAVRVAAFLCPSTVRTVVGRETGVVSSPGGDYRAAAIDYGGIYGAAQIAPSANGVFLYDRAVRLADITDGASHTLAVTEDSGRGWPSLPQGGEWINGENIFDVGDPVNTQQDNEIWSDHPGGAMVLWCDGGATFLDEGIDLPTLKAMCTRASGDSVGNAR